MTFDLPDAFEMHRTNLDHMPCLFRLEYAITSATSHAGDIEQLSAVDEVVIYGHISPDF